jgi:hypothetical protein
MSAADLAEVHLGHLKIHAYHSMVKIKQQGERESENIFYH